MFIQQLARSLQTARQFLPKIRCQSLWQSRVNVLWVLLIGSLLLTGVSLPITAQPTLQLVTPRQEIRGVWLTNVDSAVLFKPTVLKEAVEQLAKLHFNTLYPAVWNWGYTTYPSSVAKQAIGAAVDPRPIGLEGRDALAELVRQAHQKGIAVLPWFEFGFMAPEDSALAIRHPDWLTQQQDGTQVWQEGIYPRVWLNPFKPEVQQFIQALVLELVNQYDIDGIQLDDHFGLPYQFGYDAYTVQLYRNEHQGKAPPANPKDPEWVRWRANKITNFTTQLFRAIKARKNNVLLTLSPNNYDFSYNNSLQDWRTWRQQGLIEELVLQVYSNSLTAFTAQLQTPELQAARQHIPTGIGILTGLKKLPVPMQQVRTQVQAVRKQGFAGVSFFFYETLWHLVTEPEADRKAAFQSLFPLPAGRPNIMEGWVPPR
ncbi:MAG: glycoside hydrolase family 10 protein [Leptolyngbya sp. BL-A-14]